MFSDIAIPDWRQAIASTLTEIAPPLVHPILAEGVLRLPVAGRSFQPGKRGYPGLFPRDLYTSSFIMEDYDLLRDTMLFSASHLGHKRNPTTAEEPGKVMHEFTGVDMPPRGKAKKVYNTLYCACDTTLLFLIGAARFAAHADFTQEETRKIWNYVEPRVILAWGYTDAHLRDDGLFCEDPSYCGARDFALKATYLRDGGLCGRRGRRLAYPVTFLLVQAQLIAALRAILQLSRHGVFPEDRWSIEARLEAAREAFRTTFVGSERGFCIAVDRAGPIVLHNTDPAMALEYLDAADVDDAYRSRCLETLKALETPWGWRSTIHPLLPRLPGGHGDHATVWPADHAITAAGLEKHGMLDDALRAVAGRPARVLLESPYPFSEYLRLHRGRAYPDGCQAQLWTAVYLAWIEQQQKRAASI